MPPLLTDVRYAFRSLRKTPGFTIVAVLTLALGIGANTAIFSVVNALLLRPLPFSHSGRLLLLGEHSKKGGVRLPSYPNFVDWQRQATTLDLAYAHGRVEPLHGREGVEDVPTAFVSPHFLSVLGAAPVLGRAFLADEEQPGHATTAVLAHHFWVQRFGGDPAAIGKPITLGDRSYTIVGVMPAGAAYPRWADLWIPVAAITGNDRALTQRDFHADGVLIGRLHAGVSLARARGELESIAQRLAVAYPAANRAWTSVDAHSIRDAIIGDTQSKLLVMMAAVGFVLLIACANVTSLSLARAAARAREIAIRSALGAGRVRVVRQLFAESAIVAATGGVLGTGVAWIGVELLRRFTPQAILRVSEITVDWTVLAFVVVITLAVALIVGLVPALRATAPELSASLKERASGGGGGHSHQRMRATLVTAEVALALLLVAGAALLLRSFWRLQQVDMGFDPAHLVGMTITPPPRYARPEQASALYARVADAVRPIPGVTGVALANFTPLGHGGVPTRVEIGGKAGYGEWGERGASFRTISPGYFRTMRIPLRLGRNFTDADLSANASVAIVSERFARLYWPGRSAIGKAVTVFKSAQGRADFGQPIHTIVVGVVGDVRNDRFDTRPSPKIYLPYTVNPWTHMSLIVRTAGEPAHLIPAFARAVLRVEPAIPIKGPGAGFTSMEHLLASSMSTERFNTGLLTAFALSALFLAAVGVYGLVSYGVAQRTREIGLRMALGAEASGVVRLVVGEGMRLVAAGTVVGLAAAFAVTRVLRSMLYGVSAHDPLTFAAVAVVLAAVALAACYVPAWRASRVDPLVALRSE